MTLAGAVDAAVAGSANTAETVARIAAPGVVAAVATAIAVHVMLIRRHRRRERAANRRLAAARRELHDERHERSILRELDRALDQTATEQAAIDTIRALFNRHLAMQPMELHLVDAIDPVLTLVLATGDHPTKPGARTSPWDSVAARTNQTLVYDSTERLDACPHLRSRVDTPMAAVAVPLNAMGRLLGVLYGLSPEGQEPGPGDVTFLEDLAGSLAARLAILRTTSGVVARSDDIDRLTGLPDRSAMQEKVLRMLRDRVPFTVAVADIDGFGALNAEAGREVGDRALQLLAQVARKTVRPGDLIGRIGGDELLFVMPRTQPDNATRALERLREELVLAQSAASDPPFTLSIGVIGSGSGGSIEEILHRAAGALHHAKSQGGNRVVVAQPAKDTAG
ncbi:MAG: sensor domain-containing diguanylate cyclase [Actinobacteria bacterium]|nr:sensor domain-containing diguanylate cyclase [Actinomycetota bacterium]NIU20455.1 sensor domain-containing diguanylate cyclase [Actinomycetota bacterium]NIU68174.1 sensor domain-containing diguanylate cyclase [Actinomycetota bacterium]NIV55210.1 diguanylate cyclase [Actinomycetota bacterium]